MSSSAVTTSSPLPHHHIRRTTRTTETRLADGRRIVYFDSDPEADRSASDLREMPAPPAPSAVRWDPLFEDVAVIAGHRQDRTYRPADRDCPLCPSRPGIHTEVPSFDYEVVAFENRFPAFSAAARPSLESNSDFPVLPSSGRCEVLSYSADHDRSLADLAPEHVRTIVDAWAHRTSALAADPSIRYVLCFENNGADIGVTLSHPHGQIYGYPLVPPRYARADAAASRHRARTRRCLQCDQMEAELEVGVRVVTETAHWVAYVPFAARWPFEMRLLPRRHVGDLPGLTDDERDELAQVYPDLLRRLTRLFPTPSGYISAWMQSRVDQSTDDWHLAAELFTTRRSETKLKYLAGAESAAGTWINDVAPEQAATKLRTVRQRANS